MAGGQTARRFNEAGPGVGAVVASWLGRWGMRPRKRKLAAWRPPGTRWGGAALVAVYRVPTEVLQQIDPLKFNVVFLPEPGRGGGGGGSPAPAPKKQLEVPKHEQPAAVPIPVPVPPIDPPPTLLAPIQTNTSALLQSSGNSSISLATWGGGGSGGGLGSGTGNGVGPGTGGGFGGGAYAPGNGVSWPSVLLEVKPKYTPDAMRAKLQGSVELEIVVKEDARLAPCRHQSLDRPSGRDDAARRRRSEVLPHKDGKRSHASSGSWNSAALTELRTSTPEPVRERSPTRVAGRVARPARATFRCASPR
jgi:hypothetical protein